MTKAKVLQQSKWEATQKEKYECVLRLKDLINHRLRKLGRPLIKEFSSIYFELWLFNCISHGYHNLAVESLVAEYYRIDNLDDDEFLSEYGIPDPCECEWCDNAYECEVYLQKLN